MFIFFYLISALMVAVYGYLVSLFELQLFNSVSLAELASFVVIVLSVIYLRKRKITTDVLVLFFFVLWSLFTFFILKDEVYFSKSSFYNNLIRLFVYSVGYFTVPFFLIWKNKIQIFITHLTFATYVICSITIIEFVIIMLGREVDFRVSQLLTDEPSVKLSVTRVFSVFNEPAHLSIYLGTASVLIFKYNLALAKPRKLIGYKLLVFVNLILSLSLVGAIILVYLIYILLFSGVKRRTRKLRNAFIFMLAFLFLLVVVFQVTLIREQIVKRIPEVLSKEDTSSNQRVIGSFEYAFFAVGRSPAAGIGLGQLIPFYQSTNINLEYYYFKDERGGGVNNIFSSILLQTGIIGLIIFLFFIHQLLKFDKHLYFMFIILSFSWGFFNTPLFWLYLYISKVLYLEIRERKVRSFIKMKAVERN